MAEDKRGRLPEKDAGRILDELAVEQGGDDFVAGPTSRNDVGDTKRAAAKATGLMGATKKLDPELDIDRIDDGRVKSGSNAGIHPFADVPPEKGGDARLSLSNEEIAEGVSTTARKSPAARGASADASSAEEGGPSRKR